MKTKKIICMIVSIAIMCCFSVSAYAADVPATDDLSGFDVDIVEWINESFGEELARKVTVDDVDTSKAFKIYIDSNIFEQDVKTIDDAIAYLEKGDYIYEIPVYVDGDTFMANIQTGLPATDMARELLEEDELAYLESVVGKWHISAVTHYPGVIVDYYASSSIAARSVTSQPILVGSLPGFRYAVAIYPNQEGVLQSLVPTQPAHVEWEALKIIAPRSNTPVLNYFNAQQGSNNLPDIEQGETSGGGGAYSVDKGNVDIAWIVSIAAFTMAIAGLVIYKKKYGKASNKSK